MLLTAQRFYANCCRAVDAILHYLEHELSASCTDCARSINVTFQDLCRTKLYCDVNRPLQLFLQAAISSTTTAASMRAEAVHTSSRDTRTRHVDISSVRSTQCAVLTSAAKARAQQHMSHKQ